MNNKPLKVLILKVSFIVFTTSYLLFSIWRVWDVGFRCYAAEIDLNLRQNFLKLLFLSGMTTSLYLLYAHTQKEEVQHDEHAAYRKSFTRMSEEDYRRHILETTSRELEKLQNTREYKQWYASRGELNINVAFK